MIVKSYDPLMCSRTGKLVDSGDLRLTLHFYQNVTRGDGNAVGAGAGAVAVQSTSAGLDSEAFLRVVREFLATTPHVRQHPRYIAKGTVSPQPEHRAAQLAAVSGQRGRRYLQHEHLLKNGEPALLFLTALVHPAPRTSYRDLEARTNCSSSMVPRRWTGRSRPRRCRLAGIRHGAPL